jgi:hypothetical protein
LSKVVSDFQTMVWQIIGYKRFQKIFEQQIPLTEADEATISAMVKNLAAQHLTPDEVEKGLADVHREAIHGNRITLWAGENPHSYVAGLWRSDELAKVNGNVPKESRSDHSLSPISALILRISASSSALSTESVSWMATFFRTPVNLNGTR